jgi:hypothetical protein
MERPSNQTWFLRTHKDGVLFGEQRYAGLERKYNELLARLGTPSS